MSYELQDARLLSFCKKPGDIAADEVEGHALAVDKHYQCRAAAIGLETEGTGSGEEVEYPGPDNGLAKVAEHMRVVWPLHPRTRPLLEREGLWHELAEKVTFTEPLGYLDMVQLERNAAVIATDSGGVQKEAFFHRVPCVTLRDDTEWLELLDAGWNRLAPPVNAQTLAAEVLGAVGRHGDDVAPYGDGNAARLIVHTLLESLV